MSRALALSFASISLVFLFAAGAFLYIPLTANAQTNVDAVADAMCNPVIPACPCGMVINPKGGCMGGANMFMCPCQGPHTSGICIAANKCQATSYISQAGQGGGAPGMQQLMQAMQGLMQALQGGGGGGGGGDSGSYSGYPTQTGCSTFYQTNIQGNPDPCSYYVPDYGSTTNSYYPSGSNPNDVGCTSWTETSIQNDPNPCTFYVPAIPTGTYNSTTTTSGTTQTQNGCTTYVRTEDPNDTNHCAVYFPPNGGNPVITSTGEKFNPNSGTVTTTTAPGSTHFKGFLNGIVGISGFRGDIQSTGNGGTVFGGVTDFQNNTGFAGFFGGSSFSSQAGGIAERLCTSRPWANTFVSILIKPTFFDNLCTSRGYGVGPKPAVAQQVVQTVQNAISKAVQKVTPAQNTGSTTRVVPSGPYIPPQADIWASPASVSIGSRTSIFWNAKGVTSCLVTSPDGSFHETALSGGASTVPIVAATTFTISCIAPDDSHVTNTVTVTLRI